MSKQDRLKFKRGAKLFQKVQRRLLPHHKGHIVAIEPDSGQYVIGEDELEAARRAIATMPGKVFEFFRVGYPAVHKFRLLRTRVKRVR